jgi:hypothetical protein
MVYKITFCSNDNLLRINGLARRFRNGILFHKKKWTNVLFAHFFRKNNSKIHYKLTLKVTLCVPLNGLDIK